MTPSYSIKNALVSLSDKKDLIQVSKILEKNNINLFATEGTSKILIDHQIPVTKISEYTNFPEIMDGRIKSIHPKILAGILRRDPQDQQIMNLYKIQPIDLVIVNFYPFESCYQFKKNQIVNNIDIGGPTLVRAAAKNYQHVIVVVDLNDIHDIFNTMKNCIISVEKRLHFARKAFQYTLSYEKKITKYFLSEDCLKNEKEHSLFPKNISFSFKKKQDLRYGENQHQKASFYIEKNLLNSGTVSTSKQIQGKPLSYNNVCDADIALECVKTFSKFACVIVKHGNPCGAAVNNCLTQAYLSAYNADPISAFGGIVAFNNIIDEKTAIQLFHTQFIEVIIAPAIHLEALKMLQIKKNIRILITGKIRKNHIHYDLKKITNGLLVQEYDNLDVNLKEWEFITERTPSKRELEDALFSWKIAKFVKSNAVVYAKNQITCGIGAGQMSRIDATKIANIKAQHQRDHMQGSTMASDAFFPFRDGIDSAALMGITCIIQPGGSIRDEEIIRAANEHKMSMIITKKRHFKH